jgi:hypothetical protein
MSDDVLYVYAVTDEFSDPAVTGLNGAPLRAVECGPLLAVVSEHAVAPEPDEDLLWVHEQVVEGLMEGSTILPMRFGSTVEGREELIAMLEKRREEFVGSLERVRGAIELSVRAQLSSAAEPAEPEPRPVRPTGPGTAYLFERARRHRRSEAVVDLIHQPLAVLARRSVVQPGRGNPTEFKAAYLVDVAAVAPFGERVGKLNNTLGDISVTCTGPWPPYSFVSEEPE